MGLAQRLSYEQRHVVLKDFCTLLTQMWGRDIDPFGHPMEVGHHVLEDLLPALHGSYNTTRREGSEPMPWLAALVCNSAFDLALHDAYGVLHGVPTYETYNERWMNADLGHFLKPAIDADVTFAGRYPEEFLLQPRQEVLPAWHLVGGKDPIEPADLTGAEPDDGEPVLLRDWIVRDGLKCLKVKLTGTDPAWDYDRLVKVGMMAFEEAADWLTADFNCTVREPSYVTAILDRLMAEYPHFYGMLLYVEQPFPYDLEANRIDVRAVSARKPLFMDESATTGG